MVPFEAGSAAETAPAPDSILRSATDLPDWPYRSPGATGRSPHPPRPATPYRFSTSGARCANSHAPGRGPGNARRDGHARVWSIAGVEPQYLPYPQHRRYHRQFAEVQHQATATVRPTAPSLPPSLAGTGTPPRQRYGVQQPPPGRARFADQFQRHDQPAILIDRLQPDLVHRLIGRRPQRRRPIPHHAPARAPRTPANRQSRRHHLGRTSPTHPVRCTAHCPSNSTLQQRKGDTPKQSNAHY